MSVPSHLNHTNATSVLPSVDVATDPSCLPITFPLSHLVLSVYSQMLRPRCSIVRSDHWFTPWRNKDAQSAATVQLLKRIGWMLDDEGRPTTDYMVSLNQQLVIGEEDLEGGE